MLKQKHYAHERRAKDRNKKQMKERLHIQLIIEEFLSQEKLQQAQQSQNFPDLYNQVIQHLEQQKVSFSLKRAFISTSANTSFNTIAPMMQTYHCLRSTSLLFNEPLYSLMNLG